jgi:hypothetical protein
MELLGNHASHGFLNRRRNGGEPCRVGDAVVVRDGFPDGAVVSMRKDAIDQRDDAAFQVYLSPKFSSNSRHNQ